MRRLQRQTLEAFGFDGGEEGEQRDGLGRRRGRCGQTVELQAERAMLSRGMGHEVQGVDVSGRHGRIASREVEMRQVLAGRHEQGDRQQRAEVGLEAGAAHGNGGSLSGGFQPRN